MMLQAPSTGGTMLIIAFLTRQVTPQLQHSLPGPFQGAFRRVGFPDEATKRSRAWLFLLEGHHTVDGRNPAPLGMYKTL